MLALAYDDVVYDTRSDFDGNFRDVGGRLRSSRSEGCRARTFKILSKCLGLEKKRSPSQELF